MPNCEKCNSVFPNRVIIDGETKVLNSRRYCLDCSPFNTHNTIQLKKQPSIELPKTCPMCLKSKDPGEFYRRRKNKDLSTYCKSCSNLQTTKRQRKFKEQCILYKGGKCERCGYDSCNSALEFHHIEPDHKDFAISNARLTTFSTKVTEELDKCIMLCANCHREVHSK